jgi:hypothetical protein
VSAIPYHSIISGAVDYAETSGFYTANAPALVTDLEARRAALLAEIGARVDELDDIARAVSHARNRGGRVETAPTAFEVEAARLVAQWRGTVVLSS